MNPMPELAPMLKRLRLSGILETLPARNQEAIDNKLAYSEFLALLVQDEVARREHKKFNLRLRRAGFRGEKTLEGFDFAFNPAINQAFIKDLATCAFITEKVAVLIAGPCGTGKSHIAQALGHLAVRAGYDTLFTTQTKLLGQLHGARATGTFQCYLQRPYRPLYRASGEGHIRPFRSKIVQYFPSLSLVFIHSNYVVLVQFLQGLEALLRGFTF